MRSKKKIAMLCSTVLLSAGLISPTFADSPNKGAQASENKNYSTSAFISHDELSRSLEQIEKTSKGTVEVEVAGHSNQGREIYTATVGTGDKVLLLQSEIHGNEKTGTRALLNILKHLGSNNSPEAEYIRENVTIVAMPMINPDATELNRRGNDLSWSEVEEAFPQLNGVTPSWNYYTYQNEYWDYASNPGFDVNRDFNPNLDYMPQPEDFPGKSEKPGWYITPEAQTVRDVYKDLKEQFGTVDVFVDLHHQGVYQIEGSGEPVTLSLSGQFVPDSEATEGGKYAEYADQYNIDLSKQLSVAAYDALQEMGNSPFANISLYPQELDLPGTALGAFALNGSGTVLFEVTGQTQSYGQKRIGQLVKAVETGLYGIINGVASDGVYEINTDRYDDIPLTDRSQQYGH
ncbi:M14 family zinc carboxypeptidase [Pseudalkalibacillus berkeleyi]|uniref:Peptidase M14 n=1 Tax=Pseudalkalibacillus berkeleyi TaxID=1069813 RepID=A0ABS9GUT0_9BACL|nr:M14 family zinc carboxypeptidase [Pseudalkalibacillus berkeleyi]MCF6136594.1 peptidase M14 [Pseudalkalibacillus berkeleyi]